MSSQSNIAQNNEQILNDIQSLQQMEQQLFNNLETNPNLTSEQQQQIVDKMNQLSTMRINLYKTLSGVNSFFQNALSSSVGTLNEQTAAIGIVENELNQSKSRLDLLKSEKTNKMRLVEINDYYGDKYAEHTILMKIVIYTLLPIIVMSFLSNKGLLPNMVYYVLLVIVSIIGGYFFWRRYASIIMRDNMNYQTYDWYFDASNAPVPAKDASANDPWVSKTPVTTVPGTCIGQNCCSSGQTWDASLNQCIGTSSVTESFLTETMINNTLTKKENGKYKSDVNLGQVSYSYTPSFTNNYTII